MLYPIFPRIRAANVFLRSVLSLLIFLLNSVGELIYLKSFNYTFKMDNGQSLLLILPFDLTISYWFLALY